MTITRLLDIIGSFSQRFYFYLRWLISYWWKQWRPRSEIGQSSRRSATDMEQQQIFKMKYPTWTKILSSFGNKEIYCALAKFLVLIIEHTEGLFKSATERLPNFPILRQWAYYEKECQAEDGKSLKSMCKKYSQTIPLHLLGWWSWHALVQQRLCVVYHSWQAANLTRWSSMS